MAGTFDVLAKVVSESAGLRMIEMFTRASERPSVVQALTPA